MSHTRFSRCLVAAGLALVCVAAPAAAAPSITFLDADAAAAALLDDHGDPYYSLLQLNEMRAKSGLPLEGEIHAARAAFRSAYREEVRDFTDEEKAMLRGGIAHVQPYLEETYPVLAKTPWSFIKVTPGVESGLPHTRGDHIVVSAPFLTWLTSMPEDSAAPGLSNLLLHELLHVAQRDHAEAFDALYTKIWGLRSVTDITGDAWLVENQVVNPDGTDRWLFPVHGEDGVDWIWPTLLLTAPEEGLPNLMQNMRMIAVEVRDTDDGPAVRLDDDGRPIYGPLAESAAYTAAFPYTTNLYHPNEITADAFAGLAIADIFGTDPPTGAGIDRLHAWFRETFGPR